MSGQVQGVSTSRLQFMVSKTGKLLSHIVIRMRVTRLLLLAIRVSVQQFNIYCVCFGLMFQLNSTHNWKQLKSCLVKTDDCNNLSKRYKVKISTWNFYFSYISSLVYVDVFGYLLQTLKQYKLAKLTPIEAGCCRPPSE